MNLVPFEWLAVRDRELSARLAAHPEICEQGLLDNPLFGPSLRYYVLFTHWPDLMADSERKMTASELLMNRYYWYRRFAELYHRTVGPDAGIDQQEFQILESADCEVDWALIDDIDNRAAKEVQALLGTASNRP